MKELIEFKDIKKYFSKGEALFNVNKKWNKAVNGINLKIKSGEILSLVGESGSGKTTLGNLILGIIQPTKGNILFKGKKIKEMGKQELKEFRKDISVVFQDPFSAFNPRMTVMDIIKEPLTQNSKELKKIDIKGYIIEALTKVGLKEEHLFRYIHEFSGGQRQRIAIARAIATKPDFVVLDEPTSSLDVSIQAQILNLLIDLRKEYKTTYLFISHNMGIVKYISTRIAVIYLGKLVEVGDKKDLFDNPLHPYTRLLLSSIPNFKSKDKENKKVVEKNYNTFSIENKNICSFYPRCRRRDKDCVNYIPRLNLVYGNHYVACNKIKY